ncbi:hypothetical protein RclHR1_18120002 [Rhizophagus clarus]|uniref:Uncharacterized protein n=1 Tax=Rhizophagus clarus TaxID=94130 RepID=A0A2Z6R246_9GLOM|nr:hypothetical protein RclHR1_18120002 [Rhizophagus clarus]GES88636.1 hypothetical protein RCL_e5766_RclHR1_18120002 [Rhizophagus clarus]
MRPFSLVLFCSTHSPLSSARNQPPSLSSQDASEILSLLKALQQDMADVRERITALELNDQHMTHIE